MNQEILDYYFSDRYNPMFQVGDRVRLDDPVDGIFGRVTYIHGDVLTVQEEGGCRYETEINRWDVFPAEIEARYADMTRLYAQEITGAMVKILSKTNTSDRGWYPAKCVNDGSLVFVNPSSKLTLCV